MFSIIFATLITLFVPPTSPGWPQTSKDLYTIEYEQVGMDEGAVELTVVPHGNYKWGNKYNAVLKLQNNKNVTFSKKRFTAKNGDFSQNDGNGVVSIPYKLEIFKDQIINGTIDFLICNKTICIPQRNVKVQFTILGEPGC